jgi:hypothetical protein
VSDGLCIQCKLPAIPRCHSDAGKREFAISGLCEICFDGMFEDEEDEPEVEVHTLTENSYAEIGEGPWRLYLYGADGFHGGGRWFRKGPMQYPDEEITFAEAQKRSDENIRQNLEVRICDGGDNLVFHSEHGVVLHGEDFWEVLTRAFQNTVELLKKNVEVAE